MKPKKPLPGLHSLRRACISLHEPVPAVKELYNMSALCPVPGSGAVLPTGMVSGAYDSPVLPEKGGAVMYWMDVGELENEITFSEYYKAMSRERQRKVDFCLLGKDKRLSLGAGILMDQGLSAWGLNERETVVAYGEKGKPYLPRHPRIHFNLSHSGSKVLAVFAGAETGCDIERIQETDPDLAKRFFTRQEYAFIVGQRGRERQDETFFRLWTLKESFLKAVGTGLMLPLNTFAVTISPEGEIALSWKSTEARALCPGRFVFREYRMGEYCVAACFRRGRE